MANRFLNNIRINDEYTLPENDGSAGQAIVTDGSGNLSFGSAVASSAESSESIHITVKNTSGAQITKGTPVYVTGEIGNSGKIEIAPADASDESKMPALGILESTLSNNAEGFCVQGGLLGGLDTATIDGTSTTANDTVYVKPGGGLTMTKPTGSNFIQNIAKVARVHASNGSLVVSSILRTNDVPNLPEGRIWVGDGNTIVSDTVYVDEPNNRVGIGTTSPTEKLQVDGKVYIESQGVDWNETNPGLVRGALHFDPVGNGANNTGNAITFGASDSSGGTSANAGIYTRSYGTYGTKMYFATTDSYALGSKARMLIDYNGNVGIGTTNPIQKLQVAGNGAFNSSLNVQDPNVSSNGTLTFQHDSSGSSLNSNPGSGNGSTVVLKLGINYSEKMRIANNGNVGIGTTNPSSLLNIRGNSSGNDVILNLDNNKYGSTDTSGQTKLMFGWLNHKAANIAAYKDGTVNRTGFIFNTEVGYNVETEVMRITSSGNVGIGATSPTARLTVQTAADAQAINIIGRSDGLGYLQFFGSNGTTLNGSIYGATTGLGFNTSSGQKMTILSSGNVGIGTTSPSEKLQVDGNIKLSSDAPIINATSTNNSSGLRYNTTGTASDTHRFQYNGSTQLNIKNNGNVGIATTTPAYTLDVNGRVKVGDVNYTYGGQNFHIILAENTQDAYITNIEGYGIMSSGGYYYGSNLRQLNSGSTAYSAIQLRTSGDIVFENITGATAGSIAGTNERMIINSGGNVGIGTSSPGYKLDVNGSLHSTYLNIADAIYHEGDTNTYIQFVANDTIRWVTSGAERMRLNSSGNLGIGTSSPGATFHVNGTGLFSDNLTIPAEGKYVQTSGIFQWGHSGTVGVRTGTDAVGGLIDFRRWLGGGTLHHVAAVRQVPGGSSRYGLGFLADDISTNSLATTVRMYIDPNSGYVGVGTTSPQAKLDVSGPTSHTIISSGDSDTIPFLAASSYVSGAITTWDNSINGFAFFYRTTEGNLQLSRKNNSTVSNQILTIQRSNGNIGIGTTSPQATLHVVTPNYSTGCRIDGPASGTTFGYMSFYANSSYRGAINPTTTGVLYASASDYRLKENVIKLQHSIERVKKLKPSNFNFLENPNETVDGFIAHEVQEVVPEAVTGKKDAILTNGEPDYQGIDQSKLVPLLTAALQEAITKIEQLETRIQTLENK